MPCDSSHMERTGDEAAIQHAATVFVSVLSLQGLRVPSNVSLASETYYGSDQAIIPKLCEHLSGMEKSDLDRLLYSDARDSVRREIASWWERHQEVDEDLRRKAAERPAEKSGANVKLHKVEGAWVASVNEVWIEGSYPTEADAQAAAYNPELGRFWVMGRDVMKETNKSLHTQLAKAKQDQDLLSKSNESLCSQLAAAEAERDAMRSDRDAYFESFHEQRRFTKEAKAALAAAKQEMATLQGELTGARKAREDNWKAMMLAQERERKLREHLERYEVAHGKARGGIIHLDQCDTFDEIPGFGPTDKPCNCGAAALRPTGEETNDAEM